MGCQKRQQLYLSHPRWPQKLCKERLVPHSRKCNLILNDHRLQGTQLKGAQELLWIPR